MALGSFIRRRFGAYSKMTEQQIEERVSKLSRSERVAISKTVTLIESTNVERRDDADRIMKRLMSEVPINTTTLDTLRIGLCGAPGAGKSSLIERLGLHICENED